MLYVESANRYTASTSSADRITSGTSFHLATIDDNDRARLLGALSRNDLILFLGAGFSRGAKNSLGTSIPTGRELAGHLWRWLEYEGEPDDTSLALLYEAARKSQKGSAALGDFLRQHLHCDEVPAWYGSLTSYYWRRIYTTNVDDLIEIVYGRSIPGTPRLDVIVAPDDDCAERDAFLNSIQYIKLNGTASGDANTVTFSTRQYARRLSDYDHWYDQFVRDYVTHRTLFVGTELDEPLFWQAIEARDRRMGGTTPLPGSFLVTPSVSPAKRAVLQSIGITVLQTTAEEFFAWLSAQVPTPPTRDDILLAVNPTLQTMLANAGGTTPLRRRRLERFYEAFTFAKSQPPRREHRKLYLLGAAPVWQDFAHGLDAARDINQELTNQVRESHLRGGLKILALLGSAGSGKSTIMRRAALSLSETHSVYFSESEELPSPDDLPDVLDLISDRPILFVDGTHTMLPWLTDVATRLADHPKAPVIVGACRTNAFERFSDRPRTKGWAPETISVPPLSRSDIDNLIEVLDRHGMDGKLRGRSIAEKRREFEVRAQKQLLVAMREATLGDGFDAIIRQEFADLEPLEAKILYLCASLPTAAGFAVTRQQLIACADVLPSEAIDILDRSLKDVVVSSDAGPDVLRARHAIIAQQVIDSVPRVALREAYVRLLRALSHDIGRRARGRSAPVRLYKRLINHATLFDRFQKNIDDARAIFDSIHQPFDDDPHFWLQRGSLELEYGVLSLAGTYLLAAESLAPDDWMVKTSKGYWTLKRACVGSDPKERNSLWKEGEDILRDVIRAHAGDTYYPYQIIGSQTVAFLRTVRTGKQRHDMLQSAARIVADGIAKFPNNRDLLAVAERLERTRVGLDG